MQRSRLARLTAGGRHPGPRPRPRAPRGGSAAPAQRRQSPAGSARRAERRRRRNTSRSPSTHGSAPRPTSRSSRACSRTSSATPSTATPLAEEVAWPGFETGEIDVDPRELGPPRPREDVHHREGRRPGRGAQRRRRDHRLVRPGVDGHAVPGHHRLEQPQQVRRAVQDVRVRRPGPVPGQRPDVRDERRGADQEPGPELQGRLLGQRGRDDHGVPAGHRPEDAAPRLLLRPAVAAQQDQARQGQPSGVDRGLRRRPEDGRLRLPAVQAQQDRRRPRSRRTAATPPPWSRTSAGPTRTRTSSRTTSPTRG